MTDAYLFGVILPVRDIDRAAQLYSRILDDPGERVSPDRREPRRAMGDVP